MNYSNLLSGNLSDDKMFINTVLATVRFANHNIIGFSGHFRRRKEYNEQVSVVIEDLQCIKTQDKNTVLNDLESMINCLPTKAIKKSVRDFFDAQIISYFYSKRGFTNEKQDYPYKSDNIVDLFDEVEKVNNKKNINDSAFLPKPFVFSHDISLNGNTKVYLPDRNWHAEAGEDNACVCVHICKQFQSYKTTDWGIKVIPDDAKCSFATHGVCNGACWATKNKITRTPVQEYFIHQDVIHSLHRAGR